MWASQPWWLRRTAEAAQPSASTDCSEYLESYSKCFTEPGEDGRRYKRCHELLRKYRQCPGKGPELVESRRVDSSEPLDALCAASPSASAGADGGYVRGGQDLDGSFSQGERY